MNKKAQYFFRKVKDGAKTVKEKITSDEVKEGAKIAGFLTLMAVPLIVSVVMVIYVNRDG